MSLPSDLRSFATKYLAQNADALNGRTIVVGRSGALTLEALVLSKATPAAIHSGDQDFYPCMLGNYVTGQPLEFEIIDPAFEWVKPYLDTNLQKLAALTVLTKMMPYRRRQNPHIARQWDNYLKAFDELVRQTAKNLQDFAIPISTFSPGPVIDHFRRHADKAEAVFCVYGPAYAERDHFRLLDDIVAWSDPDCDRFEERHIESRSDEVAIQLSHNAINGQDNPVLLTQLWKEVSRIEAKIYSGLDDNFIERLAPPKFEKIDDAALRVEEISFYFVRPEIDRLKDTLKLLEAKAKTDRAFVANYADFDRFFQTLVGFKEVASVQNSSTALMLMLDIVDEWMSKQAE